MLGGRDRLGKCCGFTRARCRPGIGRSTDASKAAAVHHAPAQPARKDGLTLPHAPGQRWVMLHSSARRWWPASSQTRETRRQTNPKSRHHPNRGNPRSAQQAVGEDLNHGHARSDGREEHGYEDQDDQWCCCVVMHVVPHFRLWSAVESDAKPVCQMGAVARGPDSSRSLNCPV